jgi:hypothetical protein
MLGGIISMADGRWTKRAFGVVKTIGLHMSSAELEEGEPFAVGLGE